MPSYFDSLDVEGRWALTDYVYSQGDSDTPDYATLVVAKTVDEEVDVSRGRELFEGAATARFPVVGQIMEPGRQFSPSVTAIEVSAVVDERRIAFLVRWHDIRVDTQATNSPTLQVPPSEEELAPAAAPSGDEGDFLGAGGGAGRDRGRLLGRGRDRPARRGRLLGRGRSGGRAGHDGGGVLRRGGDPAPGDPRDGIAKPYFLFGDPQNPVDLWFLDLSGERISLFAGRESASLVPLDGGAVETSASWQSGVWEAVFVRDRRARSGVSFADEQYVPIAFSVWDGTARERGNRRGLSQWFYVYVEPRERPSTVGPMARTGLGVLAAELLLVAWIRRRRRTGSAAGS